jgi:acyl carrier protein
MEKEQIKITVMEILIDELGLDKEDINEQSNIYDDLGADEIDKTDIIISIEHEFGIKINHDSRDVNELNTVTNIVDYLISVRKVCKL